MLPEDVTNEIGKPVALMVGDRGFWGDTKFYNNGKLADSTLSC